MRNVSSKRRRVVRRPIGRRELLVEDRQAPATILTDGLDERDAPPRAGATSQADLPAVLVPGREVGHEVDSKTSPRCENTSDLSQRGIEILVGDERLQQAVRCDDGTERRWAKRKRSHVRTNDRWAAAGRKSPASADRSGEHRRRSIDANDPEAFTSDGRQHATGSASELEHRRSRHPYEPPPVLDVSTSHRPRVLPIVVSRRTRPSPCHPSLVATTVRQSRRSLSWK